MQNCKTVDKHESISTGTFESHALKPCINDKQGDHSEHGGGDYDDRDDDDDDDDDYVTTGFAGFSTPTEWFPSAFSWVCLKRFAR